MIEFQTKEKITNDINKTLKNVSSQGLSIILTNNVNLRDLKPSIIVRIQFIKKVMMTLESSTDVELRDTEITHAGHFACYSVYIQLEIKQSKFLAS